MENIVRHPRFDVGSNAELERLTDQFVCERAQAIAGLREAAAKIEVLFALGPQTMAAEYARLIQALNGVDVAKVAAADVEQLRFVYERLIRNLNDLRNLSGGSADARRQLSVQ